MAYQVTPEQYARRVDARDNWPKRLIGWVLAGPTFTGIEHCTVGYLAFRAGVSYDKISDAYGIPIDTLEIWQDMNDNRCYFFRPRKRAREMKDVFANYIADVEAMAPPLPESAESLREELYEASV